MAAPLGLCNICGGDDLHAGDDGFFYCSACGSQSQQFQEQALDFQEHQFMGAIKRTHRLPHSSAPGEILLSQPISEFSAPPSLFQSQEGPFSQLTSQFGFMNDPNTPWNAGGWSQFDLRGEMQKPLDTEEARERAATSIRKGYVEGLQEVLQIQCETLVEKFGVSPLVCGIVGPVWLRFLAFTRVFEKEWAEEALEVEEAREEQRRTKKSREETEEDVQELKKGKRKTKESLQEPRTSHGTKARLVWLAALKERIPTAVTLALLFLACHVAREPVLPIDIVKWALEGTLPYLAAFSEITKRSAGHPLPMDARLMFKPTNVISARKLEFMASSIAKRTGLQLPPVNFHAISCRLMRQLRLPVEELSVYVCRFFDWYTPSGLWLSDQMQALPSRVYVMAMVMIVLKVLYRIDGQGYWENREACGKETHEGLDSAACNRKVEKCEAETTTFGGQRILQVKQECTLSSSFPIGGSREENSRGIDVPPDDHQHLYKLSEKARIAGKASCVTTEAHDENDNSWSGQLLLKELDKFWRDQKSQDYDYERDLTTYIKYCRDVIFSGLSMPIEEENMCERLWRLYEQLPKKELLHMETKDALESLNMKDVAQSPVRLGKPSLSGISESSQFSSAPSKGGKNFTAQESTARASMFETPANPEDAERKLKHDPNSGWGDKAHESKILEDIIYDMEEFGFSYLPPLPNPVPCDKYLRYLRKEAKGNGPQRFVHADYFILLRACAKVISVEPKALHWCVQRVENGLRWIEGNVKNTIQDEVQKLEDKEERA